jgi:hypothetical protein
MVRSVPAAWTGSESKIPLYDQNAKREKPERGCHALNNTDANIGFWVLRHVQSSHLFNLKDPQRKAARGAA